MYNPFSLLVCDLSFLMHDLGFNLILFVVFLIIAPTALIKKIVESSSDIDKTVKLHKITLQTLPVSIALSFLITLTIYMMKDTAEIGLHEYLNLKKYVDVNGKKEVFAFDNMVNDYLLKKLDSDEKSELFWSRYNKAMDDNQITWSEYKCLIATTRKKD